MQLRVPTSSLTFPPYNTYTFNNCWCEIVYGTEGATEGLVSRLGLADFRRFSHVFGYITYHVTSTTRIWPYILAAIYIELSRTLFQSYVALKSNVCT